MLNKVKLYYFTKTLFSYLNEGQKLKIVKYNKNLQKNIDRSLIYYKIFSDRYIIYDEQDEGKGKEYSGDCDRLIYEGHFLNGKKNGHGKEYDNTGILIFEGEYLNGKRHGKGKEYNYDGKLIFEGEYINGKKNGMGKKYHSSTCKLMFKGVYLNDRKLIGTLYNKHGIKTCEINNLCGHGKEFDDYGQLKFRGTYSNCDKNGHGKEYYSNGILKLKENI